VLASVRSAILTGVEGRVVDVEVHVSSGIPGYTVVGLPDAAVRESRERVRAALLTSDLTWPQRRVTVNIAPSGVRKSGAGLDVACALGVMLAVDDLPAGVLDGVAVLGELGLDGSIRPIPGTLALVDALRLAGVRTVLLPAPCGPEAALVAGMEILPCTSLLEARACLKKERPWPSVEDAAPGDAGEAPGGRAEREPEPDGPVADLGHVRGLAGARRALEVAAAGGHHLLLVGPPGAGKTLSSRTRRWRSRRSTPPRAGPWAAASSARGRSGRRTTPPRRRPSWGAGAGARGRARSRSPTGARSSSTSWASSRRWCSTPSASPWRSGSCGSRGRWRS